MRPWIKGSVFCSHLNHGGFVSSEECEPVLENSSLAYFSHIDIPTSKSLLIQGISSLNMLSSCSKNIPELSALIRQLRDTCRIVHERSSDWSLEEQYRLLHPFSAWMDKYTISYFAISEGDTVVLAILAHFFAVVVALDLAFPDIDLPLMTPIRLRSIVEIGQVMQRKAPFFCGGCREVHYQEGMMAFPLNAVHVFQEVRGYHVV